MIDGVLEETPRQHDPAIVPVDLLHGQSAGQFCPMNSYETLPGDQREEDDRCLSYESEPLEEDLILVGQPKLTADCAAGSGGQLIVRLCDIAPNGSSLLVSTGAAAIDPGISVVDLKAIGQVIPAGHKLRVNVAGSYWPRLWPEAAKGRVPVINEARIKLPALTLKLPYTQPFMVPEQARGVSFNVIGAGSSTSNHQVSEGILSTETTTSNPHLQLEGGMEMLGSSKDWTEIDLQAPLSASVGCQRQNQMQRGAWRVNTHVESEMRCDQTRFRIDTEISAFLNGDLFFTKRFSAEISRST